MGYQTLHVDEADEVAFQVDEVVYHPLGAKTSSPN
jgi:hypothetical protein